MLNPNLGPNSDAFGRRSKLATLAAAGLLAACMAGESGAAAHPAENRPVPAPIRQIDQQIVNFKQEIIGLKKQGEKNAWVKPFFAQDGSLQVEYGVSSKHLDARGRPIYDQLVEFTAINSVLPFKSIVATGASTAKFVDGESAKSWVVLNRDLVSNRYMLNFGGDLSGNAPMDEFMQTAQDILSLATAQTLKA